MSAPKEDCGIRAVCAVTGSSIGDVTDMFIRRFGKTHILGRDMRKLLTFNGWTWTRARELSEAVSAGNVIVVTRRGFFAVVDGKPRDVIGAPICGYYRVPDSRKTTLRG